MWTCRRSRRRRSGRPASRHGQVSWPRAGGHQPDDGTRPGPASRPRRQAVASADHVGLDRAASPSRRTAGTSSTPRAEEAAAADDPEGQIAVVDLAHGIYGARVAVADFQAFNGQRAALIAATVRINPAAATVAQDLEPTWLALTNKTGYVTLEHNNALAVVDLKSAKVTAVLPFGYKDHSQAGNGLDPSRDDGGIHINPWSVLGAYEPNGIGTLEKSGRTFIVTANAGDPRSDIKESDDLRNLTVDPTLVGLQDKAKLGRLEVSKLPQDADPNGVGDGTIHRIVSFGARSFAIWDASAFTSSAPVPPVFDSGDQMETKTERRGTDHLQRH